MKALFPSNALLLSALLVLSMVVLAQISVRPVIILLLLSDSILSSKAESSGQAVTAGLIQNIPLAEGSTSMTGNTTVGRTIELNATADATGAATAYRIDEFTAYKGIRSSPYAQDLFIPLRMRCCSGFSIPSGRLHSPEIATTDPIVGGSVAIAEHLLRRFLSYHPTAGRNCRARLAHDWGAN